MPVRDVASHLSPSDLEVIRQQAEAQLRLAREDPLTYGHRPHAGQEAVHTSPAKHVLLVSANRWGKTECGMREALWRARGTHPYKNVKPHDVIWIGFPDYKFFKRVTEQAFLRWMPRKHLIDYNETEKIAKVRREDGGVCNLFFMSYEIGRGPWQGAAVDFLVLDEEVPEDIFNEAYARLIDTDGDLLQHYTPVSGMGWTFDRLYLPGRAEQSKPRHKRTIDVIEGALAEYDESRPYGVGRILVPHLSRRQVMRFASSIPDEDERMIRVFGRYRARSGVVYKQFSHDIHVIPSFEVPASWEMWAGTDPGYHGFAVIFLAQSPKGINYVVGEYFSQEESIGTRCHGIWLKYWQIAAPGIEDEDMAKTVLRERGGLVVFVDTEDPQSVLELNLAAASADLPVAFVSLSQGRKARKAGITRIQELLTPRMSRATPIEVRRPRPALGEPMLYFFDNMTSVWRSATGDDVKLVRDSRLLWELSRYLWKKTPEGASHPEDADERSAGGAHALAALRYGVMARISTPDDLAEDPDENDGSLAGEVARMLRDLDKEESTRWLVE